MSLDPSLVTVPGVPGSVQTLAEVLRRLDSVERGGGGSFSVGVIDGTENIRAGSITAASIAAGTITAALIVAGTITANEIAARTITANEIAAHSITGNEILAGSIESGALAVGAVTAGSLAVGALDAAVMIGGTVASARPGVYPRVVLDEDGLRAEVSPSRLSFNLRSDGVLYLAGQIHAEDGSDGLANIGGQISHVQVGFEIAHANQLTDGGLTVPPDAAANPPVTSPWSMAYAEKLELGVTPPAAVRPLWGSKVGRVTALWPNWVVASLQLVPAYAGRSYVAAARAFGTVPGRTLAAQLTWLDSTGTQLPDPDGSTRGPESEIATDEWSTASVVGTAPAGAHYVRFAVVEAGAAPGEVIYLTGCALSEGDVVAPFTPRPDEIVPGAINDSRMIAAGTILGDRIAARQITTGHMAAGTIDASVLVAGSVTASRIAAGAIDGWSITGASLQTSNVNPRLVMDSSGLRAYDATGVETLGIVPGQPGSWVWSGLGPGGAGWAVPQNAGWVVIPYAAPVYPVPNGKTLMMIGFTSFGAAFHPGASILGIGMIGFSAGPVSATYVPSDITMPGGVLTETPMNAQLIVAHNWKNTTGTTQKMTAQIALATNSAAYQVPGSATSIFMAVW